MFLRACDSSNYELRQVLRILSIVHCIKSEVHGAYAANIMKNASSGGKCETEALWPWPSPRACSISIFPKWRQLKYIIPLALKTLHARTRGKCERVIRPISVLVCYSLNFPARQSHKYFGRRDRDFPGTEALYVSSQMSHPHRRIFNQAPWDENSYKSHTAGWWFQFISALKRGASTHRLPGWGEKKKMFAQNGKLY